jgi:dolichol-phosphate mannosyltransferase
MKVDNAGRRQRLGVVVPLANEEDTIREFLQRVTQQLLAQDQLFCVLDNMCKDQTRIIVEEWSRKDARVVLVWAPENRCVVDAYVKGYRAALAAGCDWILEMDGGMSHRPEEIPRFVEQMEAGYDYVGGSRYLKGGAHASPVSRILISRGGSVLANLVLGTKMTDMTSGFECFTRRALEHVLRRGIMSRANFFQTEIRFMMHAFRWKEVPIHYSNSKSSLGRSALPEALRNLWKLRRMRQ